jgi:hypothetical protein
MANWRLIPATTALLTALAGCNGGDSDSVRAYIAPLDGQSNIPLDLRLMVEVGDISMPEDLPVPEDFIRVIDLNEGGEVSGELRREGTRIYFEPSENWGDGGRYAWSILPLERHPHGPQFRFPDHLLGTAVFQTDQAIELLATGLDSIEERTCMVFSRPLVGDDNSAFAVTINDVALEDPVFQVLEAGDWGLPFALAPRDEGVSVICFSTTTPIVAGARIRVWAGGIGPWNAFLEEKTAEDLMIDLRRANY